MVLDVEPVTDLLAIAIDRQRLASQCIVDDQRNEFFWKVIGAIVIGAVGCEHRQAVGMVVRTH